MSYLPSPEKLFALDFELLVNRPGFEHVKMLTYARHCIITRSWGIREAEQLITFYLDAGYMDQPTAVFFDSDNPGEAWDLREKISLAELHTEQQFDSILERIGWVGVFSDSFATRSQE